MYRRLITAGVAIFGAMIGVAHAAPSTPISYVGAGFITSASAACPTVLPVGTGFTAVYTPAASGNPDFFLLQFQIGATVIFPTTQFSLSGTNLSVQAIGATDRALPFQQSATSSLRFAPASITASTLYVTTIGTIKGAYASTCLLGIRASLTQRP